MERLEIDENALQTEIERIKASSSELEAKRKIAEDRGNQLMVMPPDQPHSLPIEAHYERVARLRLLPPVPETPVTEAAPEAS